jgi:DNA methylase
VIREWRPAAQHSRLSLLQRVRPSHLPRGDGRHRLQSEAPPRVGQGPAHGRRPHGRLRKPHRVPAHKGRRRLNGHRDANVLFFKRAGRRRDHPTEKPEDMLRYLIGKSTAPGELVLDPFAGSGTTCRAAKDLGHRYLGVEIDPRYAEIARRRVAARGRARPVYNRSCTSVGPPHSRVSGTPPGLRLLHSKTPA